MFKKFWPGVLIGVIILTAAIIRVQEMIDYRRTNGASSLQKTVTSTGSVSTTTQNNMGENSQSSTPEMEVDPAKTVSFGNKKIDVMVADTPATRFQGLSGKSNLGEYGGMLFVFEERSFYTMVMRDMLFPLDFIWLDGNTVVDISENAALENGIPESQLTRYTNQSAANMVLEVPAGFISKNGIRVGDRAEIRI